MSIRVAIIGCGSAAERAHIPALKAVPNFDIAGIYDRHAEHRLQVATNHDLTALAELNRLEEIDLVVIATPPSSHLALIEQMSRVGRHVLCEKPLGVGASDPARLQSLAGDSPAMIASVLQYRYAPAWATLAHQVREAIGSGTAYALDITIERPGTDPLSADSWRTDILHEGGIIGDHIVHYLGMAADVDPGLKVVAAERHSDHGSESATVELRSNHGTVVIRASYAGRERSNRIAVTIGHHRYEWHNGALHGASSPAVVGSLSDRDFVNRLYMPMYRDLGARLGNAEWRNVETNRTITVATLLAAALDLAGMPASAVA